jgi:hypothetical protein
VVAVEELKEELPKDLPTVTLVSGVIVKVRILSLSVTTNPPDEAVDSGNISDVAQFGDVKSRDVL